MNLDDGTPVRLGTVLAKAGEGTVSEVLGRKDLVAKVFHASLKDRSEKLAKVAAMVATPPSGATQGDGFVVLTWPRKLLMDSGRPVGYLMSRVDTSDAVEIHSLTNPYERANPLPGTPQWTAAATWAHLVTVAANLCLAVEVTHRVDAVIGDFQERNILVSDTCRVTLVDCDSMQFTDEGGRVYPCTVGRAEFVAPEVAGLDLRSHPRDRPSDLFCLALHIHLLLMAGNHPFLRGTWQGEGDQPGALILARSGEWAGGPQSRLKTHPLAPSVTFLPDTIQDLFTRAFTRGAKNPAVRPTASEWRTALTAITVGDCSRRKHQIPSGADSCSWCEIDAERTRRRKQASKPVERQTIHHVSHKPTAKTASKTPAKEHDPTSASTNAAAAKKSPAKKASPGTTVARSPMKASPGPKKSTMKTSVATKASSAAATSAAPVPPQRARRWRRNTAANLVALLLGIAVIVGAGVALYDYLDDSSKQKTLPSAGLRAPYGVAVDGDRTVYYVEPTYDRVMRLPAGAAEPAALPFNGLNQPRGIAVARDRTVIVTDTGNNRVLALSAGTNEQAILPFSGLSQPDGVAFDGGGTIYVADSGNDRVVALASGAAEQVVLPFTGLNWPVNVAVDSRGTIYVADSGNNRVVSLAAGAAEQAVLPFTGLSRPDGVAVDGAGKLYVADSGNSRVVALASGSSNQVELPFTGLSLPAGVAVDESRTVYVADFGSDQVIALPGR